MNDEPKKITSDELRIFLRKKVKTNVLDMPDIGLEYTPRQAYNTMITLIKSQDTAELERQGYYPIAYSIEEVNKLDAFNRITKALKKIPTSRDIA